MSNKHKPTEDQSKKYEWRIEEVISIEKVNFMIGFSAWIDWIFKDRKVIGNGVDHKKPQH